VAVKTVLFAWELGRGLGHLVNIRRIALCLKPRARIVAAVRNSHSAGILHGVIDSVIDAPAWPLGSTASSVTLNDILSAAGLADSATVHRLLVAWDRILSEVQPDLVIADFSPLAALAARDRIPLILIGNGYTLPPHEMLRFPPLHRHSLPVWKEEKTLEAVNQALRNAGRGRTGLSHLPLIFKGDANLVQTFPLLDPYDTQRLDSAGGPLFDYEPKPTNAEAATIFVYLSDGYEPHPLIFEALKPFAARLRIYARRMPASQIEALRDDGARIDAEPPPLHDVLPSTRLLVHGGGSGVAAEALAGGVPQLILSAQVEQDLNGEALERAGVAKFTRTYVAGVDVSPDLVGSVVADRALAARAEELGRWHRDHLRANNALRTCEGTCLELLGL
jgi:hypothetical protein